MQSNCQNVSPPFLLAAPKSLYLHGSHAPSKISPFRTPKSSEPPGGAGRHPGAPLRRLPVSFWPSGLPGWPRSTEQEPFLLCSGSRRILERGTVTAFSSGRLRSGRRRCGGRAGQPRSLATRAGVPAPPAHPRVAELARQTRGPARPGSPTFRRPLGSAGASRLRSSAREGRFVRAPRAPRQRAARAADPGTRPS